MKMIQLFCNNPWPIEPSAKVKKKLEKANFNPLPIKILQLPTSALLLKHQILATNAIMVQSKT